MSGVCCSAPGKVLVAGGYLVLERGNPGLVLATSSRFYSVVGWEKGAREESADAAEASGGFLLGVRVVSVQFRSDDTYSLLVGAEGEALGRFVGEKCPNAFVRDALEVAVLCAGEEGVAALRDARERGERLKVVLAADNEFYSQEAHLRARGAARSTRAALASLPRFLPAALDASSGAVSVCKTGLGSSAALTTSLCGAALQLLLPGRAGDAEWLRGAAYRCGLVAHTSAQGKIGSGFDVASAALGSLVYERADPATMQSLLERLARALGREKGGEGGEGGEGGGEEVVGSLSRELRETASLEAWGERVAWFGLPETLRLRVGDVRGGSETPSLVRRVLQWRASAEGQSEGSVWQRLAVLNRAIAAAVAGADGPEETERAWSRLRETRAALREMGTLAGVPIEPEERTPVLDATEALPGVVAAGVPGAGGFDAIFAIARAGHDAAVEHLWQPSDDASHEAVSAAPSLAAHITALPLDAAASALPDPHGVTDRSAGLRAESRDSVPELWDLFSS